MKLQIFFYYGCLCERVSQYPSKNLWWWIWFPRREGRLISDELGWSMPDIYRVNQKGDPWVASYRRDKFTQLLVHLFYHTCVRNVSIYTRLHWTMNGEKGARHPNCSMKYFYIFLIRWTGELKGASEREGRQRRRLSDRIWKYLRFFASPRPRADCQLKKS